MLSIHDISTFQERVWSHYSEHKRDMPWRNPEPDGSFDPYKILVSEIMLQQTQVSRVIPKYQEFLQAFPNVESLARAELAAVYGVWQGLGYNRRARFLREAAKQLVSKPKPWKREELIACKGIGPNTADAIMVYSYNEPLVFIETNIRTVYLHHFLADAEDVDDKQILELLEQTIDREHPREFYWALMDYGTYLKSKIGSNNHRSKQYAIQSVFDGSARQIRGRILKELARGPMSDAVLSKRINDDRYRVIVSQLIEEKLVCREGSVVCIAP